jgi:hypothetical protein
MRHHFSVAVVFDYQLINLSVPVVSSSINSFVQIGKANLDILAYLVSVKQKLKPLCFEYKLHRRVVS